MVSKANRALIERVDEKVLAGVDMFGWAWLGPLLDAARLEGQPADKARIHDLEKHDALQADALQAAEASNALLVEAMREACALLAERTQGSPARSAGHNARLRLESALAEKAPA